MGPKKENLASVQASLPIDTIREGVVIMKDSSLRAVVMVSTLNFALKSEKEKDSIVAAYQGFLNALEFPVQFLATSKKLDLSGYLASIDAQAAAEKSAPIKIQLEEYKNFIATLLDQTNIMEKRFFVVIPYYGSAEDSLAIPGLGLGKKKTNAEDALTQNFETKRKVLSERVDSVINGLSSLGLRCAGLETEDLLQLFYNSYNPSTAKNQKISVEQDIDRTIVMEGKK